MTHDTMADTQLRERPSALTQWIVFASAGGLFALCAWAPWHPDPEIRRAAGLVLGVLILWISEVAPLGVVAIAIPIVATATGILSWQDAVRAWGDPIIFLFMGAFLLARALDKHGAFAWVSRRGLRATGRTGGWTESAGVLGLSGLLSSMQNNTAVTAMLLPGVTTLAKRTALPAAVLLALAYGATFGGLATPVGTAPNFLGFSRIKEIDPTISFIRWMAVGVPAWLGTTLIGWGVLTAATILVRRSGEPSPPTRSDEPPVGEYVQLDYVREVNSRAARCWALAVFATAVVLWLVPGIMIGLRGQKDPLTVWLQAYLPESLVPIALAWPLFLIRTGPEHSPVLDRRDFQHLDWDTLFLIAGGLCLGKVLEASGAALALAGAVADANLPPVTLMLALAGVTVLLSELTSNTATASLMIPIAASIAPSLPIGAVDAIWLVTLSASLGFALPMSTPPNALVYGTGLVPLRFMAAIGIIVDLLASVWVVCCVVWWA